MCFTDIAIFMKNDLMRLDHLWSETYSDWTWAGVELTQTGSEPE
jgi:hypothetical protein